MSEVNSSVSALIRYLLENKRFDLDIPDQFNHPENADQKCNAAFLIVLSGDTHPDFEPAYKYLYQDCKGSKNEDICLFYISGLDFLTTEFSDRYENDSDFSSSISEALTAINNKLSADIIQEKIWQIFFPEAVGLLHDQKNRVDALREKRKINIKNTNPHPIENPGQQILFTSNILLTVPLNSESVEPLNIEDAIKNQLNLVMEEEQKIWYDHPVPIGIPKEKNEILYGIHGLDQAIAFEKERGNLSKDDKVSCLLSASVTHDGLHNLAKSYIENEVNNSGPINHLNLFIFSENDTRDLINGVLIPAKRKYLPDNIDEKYLNILGVDGEYGRHYSFLKAISAFWQIFINPEIKATFKIDLDQVFPQKELVRETGKSVFEHFCTDLWGAEGSDNQGNNYELGMIAGALVNEKDISKSIFTPDIPFPDIQKNADEQIFFSMLPQASSTEAEMMTRYDCGDFDGKKTCVQRVHVTGGTNGILVDMLHKYRPFTPSFIGRAEDQAYIMSVLYSGKNQLAYLHQAGLIMRHDKEAFAQEAMEAAKVGKMVGDYTRILYFSAYARLIDPDFAQIKKYLDPFTGCFISHIPLTIVYLRFALKSADLYKQGNTERADEFIENGSKRIRDTINFTNGSDKRLVNLYNEERQGWDLYYLILAKLAYALEKNDPFAMKLQKKAREIIRATTINS